jgi:hypothetical protein
LLVCNVSLRPPHRSIAADLAEVAAALDDLGSGSGQIVFATLVDDPASVQETVDAYLGAIMSEAASSGDMVDAVIPAGGGSYATFDGTAVQVTLSNGNLTATHSSTATDCGARSTAAKSTGKYYFEITVVNTPASANNMGILLSTGTYNDYVTNAINCTQVTTDGNIFTNNTVSGNLGGAFAAGDVACFAIDLTARKFWIRKNGGLWNNTAGHDPATGANGKTIAATGAFAPAVGFINFTNGNAFTGNFGATAFAQAVPSGFTAGWL